MPGDLNLESTAQRKSSIMETNIDGEIVMMSIENGQYYGLDPVASEIWGFLEKPMKVINICQHLQDGYQVSEEQCKTDVLQFLKMLRDNNVIDITP